MGWNQPDSGGGSGVSSFNTRTGAVTLAKADVTGTGIAAADIGALGATAAAGGDLTGNFPNPTIGSGKVITASIASAAVTASLLADPGTDKVYGSNGAGAAAAVFPPGYEIGYDQVTGNVTVSSNTESSGTTIIACAAHTFDDGAVLLEVYLPSVSPPSNGLIVSLFESSTQIGRLGNCSISSGQNIAVCLRYRFTPSAAAHTYTISAYVPTSGSGTVSCGGAGTSALVPAFARFVKV